MQIVSNRQRKQSPERERCEDVTDGFTTVSDYKE